MSPPRPPAHARPCNAPWGGWWRCRLLALLAVALPLQSTAIALSRLAPAHVHVPAALAQERDRASTASSEAHHNHNHGHVHEHDEEPRYPMEIVPSAASGERAHHGHIAHHLHAHDDLSVVAMSESAGDDDPSAPGKGVLVDQEPIAGVAAWRPPPHETTRPLGAAPRRFVSHVSSPPERPPR